MNGRVWNFSHIIVDVHPVLWLKESLEFNEQYEIVFWKKVDLEIVEQVNDVLEVALDHGQGVCNE